MSECEPRVDRRSAQIFLVIMAANCAVFMIEQVVLALSVWVSTFGDLLLHTPDLEHALKYCFSNTRMDRRMKYKNHVFLTWKIEMNTNESAFLDLWCHISAIRDHEGSLLKS